MMTAAELYARELGNKKYDPLPYDVERGYLTQLSNGDESVRGRLILSNLRFVVSVSRGFSVAGERVEPMDLIQEGNYGLIYSIPRFKVVNVCRLCSYSLHWIKFFVRSLVMSNEFKFTTPVSEYPELETEAPIVAEMAEHDLHEFLKQHMEPREAYVLVRHYCNFDGGKRGKSLEELGVEMRCTPMNVKFLRDTGVAKLREVKEQLSAFKDGTDY